MKKALASFRHHNYRWWFGGQLVSLAGSWAQSTAQAYLAFELTHSPAFLGYLALAAGAPTWFFMLYAGTLVDRWPKRTIMFYTQTIMLLLAIIMAALTYLKVLEPWHILVLAALLGVANSFDAPARQSIVSELVERSDLTNAIALNSAMFNLASTVGPALAGIVFVVYGPVWCFVANACSFVAVLISLYNIKVVQQVKRPKLTTLKHELMEGFVYVKSHHVIFYLVLMAAAMSVFGVSYERLFPSWAMKELHADARVAGYLMAARGLGAVTAAFGLAHFSAVLRRGKLMTLGSFIVPLATIAFALTKWLPASLIFVSMIGFAHVLMMNVGTGIIQTEVQDKLRGRVSSIYSFIFFGLLPLGGFTIGLVAEHINQTTAVIAMSVSFLICSLLLFTKQPQIRKLH